MKVSPPERFETVAGDRPVTGLRVALEEQRSGARRQIWMAVDSGDAGMLSARSDVFLPALAFYAMLIREDLDCGGMRTDAFFVRNVQHATQQYARWYSRLRVPDLANYEIVKAPPRGTKFASFCSGGVDGLFTVHRHTAANAGDVSRSRDTDLDYAYHVLYTKTVDEIAGHGAAARALETALSAWAVKLIRVYSNIYMFAPAQMQNYAMVSHGASFASLAHCLSRDVGATMLATSHTDGDYMPYGSTPEVDPMFSSSSMAFVHDGTHYTRVEKVTYLCRSREALSILNVCDRRAPQQDYSNCSRCHKCLRTMIAIDLEGKSGSASPAFDWSAYSPEAFGKLQLRGAGVGDEQIFADEIRDAARGRRPDIAAAAARAAARSRLFTPLFMIEDTAKRLAVNTGTREALKGLKRRMLSLIGAAR